MRYIELTFHGLENEMREIATAVLTQAGAYGFEENAAALKAYIKESDIDDENLEKAYRIIGQVPAMEIIEEVNWNAEWESSFDPVYIPRADSDELYAVIRASFHDKSKDTKHDILITPRMSFGTGHHATTYLMVKEMSRLQFAGKKFFDYGTGTGILAIIAFKEGAKVTAVDYDENCIKNASENFIENNCDIKLFKDETITGNEEYDIILANINRNVIIDNLSNIFKALKPSGSVLFSGMLASDEQKVIPLIIDAGFTIVRSDYKDQWWMLHTTR